MEMYLQEVISKKNIEEKLFFVRILSATDEKSMIRIRIRTKMSRIHNAVLEQHNKNIYYCRDLTATAVMGSPQQYLCIITNLS
jgi:hypothetical protein